MINPRKIEKLSQFLMMVCIILFATCSGGCASDRIEYDPPDSNWVGKVIHFKEPMAYIVFSNKDDAKEYGFDYAQFDGKVIERELVIQSDATDPANYLTEYPQESIKNGMGFTILGTYWVRHSWIRREFAPEYQDVILKDENNILSVFMLADGFKFLELFIER